MKFVGPLTSGIAGCHCTKQNHMKSTCLPDQVSDVDEKRVIG